MKIGIIGGAGVAATNKLCDIIEQYFTVHGAYRDEHHPEMIIWQATNVPSRSMYLEGKGPSFIDEYIGIATKLNDLGADVLAMCCNTAHYAIDEIKRQTNIPFINVIKEVVMEVKKNGAKKVGLIASDGCLKGKVYEKYFDLYYPETILVYPDSDFQKEITRGICNIKNKSRFLDNSHPDRPKNIFNKVVKHLEQKGIEKIIIGCTDIRVDYENEKVMDSLEILASKIINMIENGK